MGRIANDNTDTDIGRPADDDLIQPFQIERSGLRGRIVRLGPVLNDILAAHDYPQPVANLLAETVALGLLLSSMLKYDGIFTLQTSGDGPVKTMVSDVTNGGDARGYASIDIEKLDAIAKHGGPYDGLSLTDLTGKGYLAFTVDQGAHTERYQGIVALEGETLTDSVRHYFDQSEQIGTSLKVFTARDKDGKWRAGAIMLQRMPEESHGTGVVPINPAAAEERSEDWNRAGILLQSVTGDELTAPDLHSHDLLMRLFHEEGVRIFPAVPVVKKCRCSEDKVLHILKTLPDEDLEHATKEGEIEMTCAFCATTYTFNAEAILKAKHEETQS